MPFMMPYSHTARRFSLSFRFRLIKGFQVILDRWVPLSLAPQGLLKFDLRPRYKLRPNVKGFTVSGDNQSCAFSPRRWRLIAIGQEHAVSFRHLRVVSKDGQADGIMVHAEHQELLHDSHMERIHKNSIEGRIRRQLRLPVGDNYGCR